MREDSYIPERTAVIFIDMQNDYIHDDGGLVNALDYNPSQLQEDADNMSGFLKKCRSQGLYIIHVRTHQSDDTDSAVWTNRYPDFNLSICKPGSWGAEFYRDLKPPSNEPVVTKNRYSGFEGTNLELILRSNKIETVVLCGALTHVCVEATARDAFHRDYQVVLLEDCCTTTRDFQDLHEATLKNMERFYGKVMHSSELIEELEEA